MKRSALQPLGSLGLKIKRGLLTIQNLQKDHPRGTAVSLKRGSRGLPRAKSPIGIPPNFVDPEAQASMGVALLGSGEAEAHSEGEGTERALGPERGGVATAAVTVEALAEIGK